MSEPDDHAAVKHLRGRIAYLKRTLPWPSGQPSHPLSKRESMLAEIDKLTARVNEIKACHPERYRPGRPKKR